MILYKTLKENAVAEQVIQKSKFICSATPVDSKEEADQFIKTIKEKYKDATHNVPAMVIGDKFQVQWASDDGEPSGTSGAPIVQMLVKEGITNVAIVVTRYFGGEKLGTGGLVRAYTSSAKLGINAAGVIQVKKKYELVVKVDYKCLPIIENLEKDKKFEIKKILYEEVVTLTLWADAKEEEALKGLISNVTEGKEKIVSEVHKNA